MSTIIRVDGIMKKHGNRAILDGAEVSIAAGAKIGVVGRNGAGKSTLIRIIVGEEEADAGSVIIKPDAKIGYLEQHEPFSPEETVMAFLERRSGKPEWKCATAAGTFQIKKEMLEAKLGTLSEGFRMRARLADMILQDPDFLLLDEPTNYLDLHTVLLLERFLQKTRIGFLLVSHDREFLKNTCDATLEVERGGLFLYPGDIESFLGFKEQELERQQNENKKIDAKRRHLQSFVDRFRAKASKASSAQSKLKQIARLKPIEIAHKLKTVKIRIPRYEKMKKGIALVCNDLAIGYPGRTVASGIALDVERGRHAAVLGDNGQGKTTFLRTIAGQLAPTGGEFRWGQGLEVGYYGQKSLAALDPQDRVDTYLRRAAASDVLPEELMAMAGSFLFTQDDQEKRIGVLSGGERARLCLAGLLLSKKPVFLLDEPTNHLDFETVEALGEALADYPGTIFFVSHNRTFVSLLATAILEVGGGGIRSLPGTYDEYVWLLEQEIDRDIPRPSIVDGAGAAGGAEEAARLEAEREEEKERRREQRDELKEQQKRLKKVEARVIALEDDRARVLARMAAQPTVFSPELNKQLSEISKALTAAEGEWMECTAAIEWLGRE
ncbi:MAG: putative transporter ATP-binding protein YheS [Candidatus Parcubacteria bacterium]|jgi:ATP-binding cassette subfamily F protein 3